ncbi:MAG TPA: nitroreductase [Rhodospirillaceae bacterium]|nr:nitroreductase [Rhodospirillaceae bacterium]HAT35321.1 nitroreductase [Rhodospirillaceae bacterium]
MSSKEIKIIPNDKECLELLNPVDQAIVSRGSTRAFLSTPVPRELVEQILKVAAWAPSGTNMQPWQVYVLSGAARQNLSDRICQAYFSGEEGHTRTWKYYPDDFFEPYKGRRRACGIGLYQTIGIGKGETEKMKQQRARNYKFFDAPVGMIYTIHQDLEIGSWMDLGMFLQNVMVSARGHGLHTCPQAAFSDYHNIIREHLDIPEEQIVVCGMSMGYADQDAVVNGFRPDREELSSYANFNHFGD